MPTILQVNVTANIGSTGRIAEQIGKAAIAEGWSSYIAYGRHAGASESTLVRVCTSFESRIHYHLSKLTDREGLFSYCATLRFIRKIKQIKPDVIHLHNIHGAYLNYKLFFNYLNRSGIPVIWTLHDCWPFTGHCTYFDEPNCYKWESGCEQCPYSCSYPASLFADASSKNYKLKKNLFGANKQLYLVPVSNWLLNFVKRSFLSHCDSRVLHNGIDLHKFCIKPTPQNNKYRIIGVAIPWDRRKGLSDFYALRDKLDKDKYEIMLVGLTPKQISVLPDGIIGVSRTNSVEELAQLYSSADVFVNPTYADNYPTTNLESIACGTPIITYKTGGSPESVTEQTGAIVEQGDIDGIVNAIHSLEHQDRSELRKKCRAYAEEHFDKDKCFQKYMDLYKEILENK